MRQESLHVFQDDNKGSAKAREHQFLFSYAPRRSEGRDGGEVHGSVSIGIRVSNIRRMAKRAEEVSHTEGMYI